MAKGLEISLLGELRVVVDGRDAALPASRKARALLAFLVATGRPHRRERLCELFWELPDDPRAALRWALSKLRQVVDAPGRTRILADRERVLFDAQDVVIDIRAVPTRLRDADLTVGELQDIAAQLDAVFLDGLDGAGDTAFQSWLTAEREDVRGARTQVLERLTAHPDLSPAQSRKWTRLWQEANPAAVQQAFPRAIDPADHDDPGQMGGAGVAMAPEPDVSGPDVHARSLKMQRIGFCEVPDGTKIAYATLGSGPPLLKAANWLSHLEYDWAGPIWGRSFAEIARVRTFVRYDERGCGLSDWDVEDLSFEAFVEDLEAVADKLDLERFPLLGISQGAAVSIEYAVRYPERVSALILVGGYAAGWRYLASPEEQARREAVMTLTQLGWGTDNPAYRHIFSQTFMPEASAADLVWFDEFQRQTTSPANAARFQEAFGWIDVRHRLAEIVAPTIVLHSRHDQRIPIELGRSLASGIPNARFVPLESRNHILVNHEPALKVCFDEVGRFLHEHRA